MMIARTFCKCLNPDEYTNTIPLCCFSDSYYDEQQVKPVMDRHLKQAVLPRRPFSPLCPTLLTRTAPVAWVGRVLSPPWLYRVSSSSTVSMSFPGWPLDTSPFLPALAQTKHPAHSRAPDSGLALTHTHTLPHTQLLPRPITITSDRI